MRRFPFAHRNEERMYESSFTIKISSHTDTKTDTNTHAHRHTRTRTRRHTQFDDICELVLTCTSRTNEVRFPYPISSLL